jgi:murein DD-endopeptidase MepM/ murein hydrolase activator NlpD
LTLGNKNEIFLLSLQLKLMQIIVASHKTRNMSFQRDIHILTVFLMLFTASANLKAQDLLARQAPVDRKARTVDTLALQRIMEREMEENPSYELYEEWDNIYAHKASVLPETFKIDLRNFCMPTKSRAITSNYGARWGRQHKGLDIKVYVGDTIRAAFSGKVRVVRYNRGGYGKYIVIRHNNGLETIYGHLSRQLVEENQVVRAGDVIGLGGNTGRSTGSHLHFETRLCGIALNPALMFDFRAQDVTGDYYVFHRNTYEAEGAEATRLRGVIGNGSYTPDMVRGGAVASKGNTNNDNTQIISDEPAYHKVAKGETLYTIAKKRGVTIDELCKLNHLTKKSKLRVGMILRFS